MKIYYADYGNIYGGSYGGPVDGKAFKSEGAARTFLECFLAENQMSVSDQEYAEVHELELVDV